MKLIVVRHGETDYNKKGILQGHLPTYLSAAGKKQAEAVARRLSNTRIDTIYTSDLPRARQTAEAIARYHPTAPFIEDRRLRERDFGENTGKPVGEAEWPSDENTRIPGGESRAEQRRRLKEFYGELLKAHRNDTVLIVSHGGSIRAIINIVRPANAEPLPHIKNTAVTEFEITNKGVKQLTFNCDRHLEK